MVLITKIFGGNKKWLTGVGAAAFVCVISGASAAVDNTGCDNDDNMYITPELALCETHAYNIGAMENQSGDAQKQLMKDVVALKTTVITQQMYAQYEFLETTVKRLKTQLQKEVLLASLEANGAKSSDSNNEYSGMNVSGNKDTPLEGVDNCNRLSTYSERFDCLRNGANVVIDAAESGNVGGAKKQMDNLKNWYTSIANALNGEGMCSNLALKCANLSGKTNIIKCAEELTAKLMSAQECYERGKNKK